MHRTWAAQETIIRPTSIPAAVALLFNPFDRRFYEHGDRQSHVWQCWAPMGEFKVRRPPRCSTYLCSTSADSNSIRQPPSPERNNPIIIYFRRGIEALAFSKTIYHLALSANAIVVNLEYGLSEHYPYPGPVHDVGCPRQATEASDPNRHPGTCRLRLGERKPCRLPRYRKQSCEFPKDRGLRRIDWRKSGSHASID